MWRNFLYKRSRRTSRSVMDRLSGTMALTAERLRREELEGGDVSPSRGLTRGHQHQHLCDESNS